MAGEGPEESRPQGRVRSERRLPQNRDTGGRRDRPRARPKNDELIEEQMERARRDEYVDDDHEILDVEPHDIDGKSQSRGVGSSHPTGSAKVAARIAAATVAELTGHLPEMVSSMEPCGDGWMIGVEVVEARRIPDSADVLATYEVRLGEHDELRSYRRVRRYSRGRSGEGR